jgi:uncharacterized membrane protein
LEFGAWNFSGAWGLVLGSFPSLSFDFPLGWWLALPLAAALGVSIRRQHRRGVPGGRIFGLASLRSLALMLLLFLAARPVWIHRQAAPSPSRPVVVLLDRSESMSLRDPNQTRYQQALEFLRDRLQPALGAAQLPVQTMLFAQELEAADSDKLGNATPDGKRTNLGGAIAAALANSPQPPRAVIALTDGIVNQSSDNSRALASLVEEHVPFLAVGFGSDQGAQTLSLREVDAPAIVSTKAVFNVSAQLEMVQAEELPAFDLVLFRDGQIQQKKSVLPGKGSRTWLENFQVTEDKAGSHNYAVQLLAPDLPNVKCVNLVANTQVRVSDEKELRVLYIQGALTWDYKFINLALRRDPMIKLTGLTRTSKQSVFRQNVESAGEFLNGFPTSLEELSSFRLVVLSNLRPVDLSVPQQELLAKFCGELGGGVLMLGGPATFDASWQNSRLEQLLPVVFSGSSGVQDLDRPFRLQLTDEALQNPIFQIADGRPLREVWGQLPTFAQYGRVDAAKPGAQVWVVHPSDVGPRGPRILMAAQRYGAGLSAVLTIQNFWRWRLEKDSDPAQFDRFWRQLFRFLSEVGRQDIAIHLPNQELHPQIEVQAVLEKQPNPRTLNQTSEEFRVRIEDGKKNVLHEETLQLEPSHPVDLKFHAEKPDVYSIIVADAQKVPIATRSIEVRDVNVELQDTARNMEALRQWASVSDGLAIKLEDCRGAGQLVAQIKSKIEEAPKSRFVRRPAGMNAWMMAVVLGFLGAEWCLRKRWLV